MAPADEYTAAAGAGKLKLKGVKDGRVEKKKKKKKEKKEGEDATADAEREASAGAEARGEEEDVDEKGYRLVGKTEAEKRYEEERRKRVCISLFFLLLPFLLDSLSQDSLFPRFTILHTCFCPSFHPLSSRSSFSSISILPA